MMRSKGILKKVEPVVKQEVKPWSRHFVIKVGGQTLHVKAIKGAKPNDFNERKETEKQRDKAKKTAWKKNK